MRFVKKSDDMLYNPKRSITSFYQICQYPYKDDKHLIRKTSVDELGNIIDVQKKRYTKDVINKFISKTPSTKYIIYPTNDLSLIDLPQASYILQSQSQLLN
jgi:hypothetical protein